LAGGAVVPPAARTQLKMLVTWQPNSLANSAGVRPERTSSTIWVYVKYRG
jgi:hypothetical protein